MKTLYLLRHAKSDWSHPGQDDFDRGINQRGEKSIHIMRDFLKEKGVKPDIVISSPATRAKLTAEGIVKKLEYKRKDIVYLDEIYDTHMSGYEGALSCVMQQDTNVNALLLVGHNFAISQLANYLSGRDLGDMKTASIVCLEFGVHDWSDISYGNGKVIFSQSPKTLK